MSTLLQRALIGLATETPPDPDSANNFQWSNPYNNRIIVYSVDFTFNAGGTASDRWLVVSGADGSGSYCHSPAPGSQPDTSTWNYHFSPCVLGIDQGTDNSTLWAPLSSQLYLDPGQRLIITATNLTTFDEIFDVQLRFRAAMPY